MAMNTIKLKEFISRLNPFKSNFFKKLDGGEWVDESKAFAVWIISLAFFFLILYLADYDFTKSAISNELMMFLFLDIIIGGLSFIYLIVQIIRNLFKKGMFVASVIALALCGIIVIGFFSLLSRVPSAQLSTTNSQSINAIPAAAPSPTDASPKITATPSTVKTSPKTVTNAKTDTTSKITCIGPDDKKFEATMDECKALNEKWGQSADYMVDCNIHPDCGGGTTYMAKSECDKPCSGKTTVGPQATTSNNANSNSRTNYFCVNNVTGYSYYTSSGEQCNLDNTKAICRNSVKVFIYDPCMDSCLKSANDGSAYCIYNLPEQQRDACLTANSAEHQKCMDACGIKSQEGNAKCN